MGHTEWSSAWGSIEPSLEREQNAKICSKVNGHARGPHQCPKQTVIKGRPTKALGTENRNRRGKIRFHGQRDARTGPSRRRRGGQRGEWLMAREGNIPGTQAWKRGSKADRAKRTE